MEKKNDKHLDLEKENTQHNQGDQETESKEQRKDENISHKDVGNAQISNSGENIGIKKEKRKLQKIDFIYFAILFICLIAIAGLFFYMKSEGTQCIKNPYVYGASKMGSVSCYCQQDQDRITPAYFSFNDTSFSSDPKGQTLYTPIEWNNLSVTP